MMNPRDRIEQLFSVWGHIAYRRARWVIAAMVLAVAALASQLPNLYLDTSTEGFFHEDDPVRVAYDAFRERFGRDTAVMVAVRAPRVFDFGFLERLRALHRDLEADVPHLVEVQSLINARETRGAGDELIVGELLEDWPAGEAELRAVEARALANPLYVDSLISADQRYTALFLETQAYSSLGQDEGLGGFDDAAAAAASQPAFITGAENAAIVEAVQEVAERHRAPDFEIFVAGTPVMTELLQAAMRDDMALFTLLSIGTIALLLASLFRRVAGVILPLVTVLLSLTATLSIMALSGIPLTVPTQILPSFLLAVGVGGSVHILAIFYQARRRGESAEDAIAYALGHSGLAVVMTALTTAGGLLSFVVAELLPIAEFGIIAPVGVMVALLFTLALLPALIAVFPMRAEQVRAEGRLAFSQRWLVRAGDLAVRRAGLTAAVWAVLLAVALLGASRLGFSHDPMAWFPEEHPLRQANDVMNEHMGGSSPVEFLIETGRENGLHEPALLRRLEAAQQRALELEMGQLHIGKAVSVVDVTKEIHQALNENRPEFRAIPGDRQLVAQELLLFENSGSDDLEDVVDPQFSLARLTMRMPFSDAAQFSSFFELLKRELTPILGPEVELEMTGMGVVAGHTIHAVMYTMARSYLVALLVVCPLLVLLIGRVRIGLVAMIPNVMPILLTLGLMGWAGFALDAFTLLIGCIAIGLAVDDTIHFMHNFRRYYERSGDVRVAVRQTLETTGQALLFTSLVLSTGFFIFALSSMSSLASFGILTGFTIITAFLADLLLAPALVALVARPSRAMAAAAGLEAEATR